MTVATVRLSFFLFLASALTTLAADSTGKDASVTDLSTGNGAVYKLIDNGDGTAAPKFVFVSGGGAATKGKDYNIHDLTTGDALMVQLIDNGDGTKSPVVACPDCAGGGGGGTISDTAYSSTTWNGDTTAGASKNALRDYFVLFDSDGDGKVDVLDIGAGIVKTNSSGVPSIATSDTDYSAAPTQQTVGDADVAWLSAKDFLTATAAMTASRAVTMPAANSAPAGKVRTFVDKVTSTSSAFSHSFIAAGSDTINGNASYAPSAGPVSVSFVTDGSTAWTVIYTASQPAFTDMRDKLTDSQAALLVKPACAVVATSNVTLSGEQTIDGQLTSASLVLATAQTTGSENGPWVSASGAWTRPGWYSSGSTVQAPRFLTTFIRLGTTFSGSTWRMTTASVTIDTTATTWVQTPISLASANVTSTLPVANGGTGITSFGTGVATGLGAAVNASGGFLTANGTATVTNKTATALVLSAGTSSANTAATYTAGTLESSPRADAWEHTSTGWFVTNDTTNGQSLIGAWHEYRLTGDGSAIGNTIADFFPTGSAIPTATNGVYEIVWDIYYLKTTAGTVTYTLTNTQTYTNLVAFYQQSNAAGISAAGNSAQAGLDGTTTAAAALPATGSLTTAVDHHCTITAYAECGTAGNIRLQLTESAGTVTPRRGSRIKFRRMPAVNVGTFAN